MEIYGLVAQTRRAVYSIPMNLAGGAAREGAKEFAQFVNIAIGSCEELRYQLLLAKDLSYVDEEEYASIEREYEGRRQTYAYPTIQEAENGSQLTAHG